MKTISKKDEILRVDEETANLKVKSGWSFTPKSEWKKKVRDINKKVNETKTTENKK